MRLITCWVEWLPGIHVFEACFCIYTLVTTGSPSVGTECSQDVGWERSQGPYNSSLGSSTLGLSLFLGTIRGAGLELQKLRMVWDHLPYIPIRPLWSFLETWLQMPHLLKLGWCLPSHGTKAQELSPEEISPVHFCCCLPPVGKDLLVSFCIPFVPNQCFKCFCLYISL